MSFRAERGKMTGMIRIFSDPRCLEHGAPPGYPERPERLAGILERLRERFEIVSPADDAELAVDAAVRAVHADVYVDRLERAAARGDGLIDSADNPLGAGTLPAARAAVATALAAADWVAAGERRAAFAAVRPPGHHAERATAMGFCYFNNAAVAAQHLRDRHGFERVAILDFDVHHGNGTQHLFETRADVFYGSLHQFPFYPGTGAAGEIGIGAGEGATLNVPLPVGADDAVYQTAFEATVLPALRRYAPQVLIVSAGFDAWQADPVGGMRVSEEGFTAWGRMLGELAVEHCRGQVLSLLEGGYDLRALPRLVAAYLDGLARAGLSETVASAEHPGGNVVLPC